MISAATLFARPPLVVAVTDTSSLPDGELCRRVDGVLSRARPGSVLVQLRDKELPARRRLGLGAALRDACRRHDAPFVVNERLDLAVLLEADGVHLGEAAVETADARRILPEAAFVSRACHDVERVASIDADAVLLSPVAAARKGRPALGLQAIERARALLDARAASRPRRTLLYALGGIDASNAAECVRRGADGVAVIGALFGAEDPTRLLESLDI